LLGLFAYQQRPLARCGGEPLIPPGPLRYRSLVVGQAVVLCVNTAVGVFFVLTLHLLLGLRYAPLAAASTFVPATLGIVVATSSRCGWLRGSGGCSPLPRSWCCW
jgi:hypothetical protein